MTVTSSDSDLKSPIGTRLRNLLIVLVAIALSVALFFALKTQSNAVSLTKLDQQSTPLEVAISNGKPSLIEFYADWCTSCQAMAPDINQLEKQYDQSVNFVMLNVDNSKWLPEILRYRVDGIPHFVFLNNKGEAIAQSIGEQPRSIMASNLEALVTDVDLPYAQSSIGQVSKFTAPATTTSNSSDPRLHSSQVKQ